MNQYCNSSNKPNVGSYMPIVVNDEADVVVLIGEVYLILERYLMISSMLLIKDYHFLEELG